MAVRFSWFLPTGGDGRQVASATVLEGRTAGSVQRPATVAYLGQVARAAEAAGFEAVLTPVGAGCEDPLVLCSAVAPSTTTLRFLVAFRPGFVLPTLFAQQAATFQRMTGDRLLLNVVTGGDPVEQRSYGDPLDHDRRYARTGEFLEVFDRMWSGEPFDHTGPHFSVEGGGLRLAPVPPKPTVYFGGQSPAAVAVAARHADTWLTWGEPPALAAQRLEVVQKAAADAGREVGAGMRLHVIARDTPEQAWAEADRLLAAMDPAAIAAAQARFARMDSVAQSRMTALHRGFRAGSADGLEVSPGLWAGVGLVRDGAATALVGSYEQVAERLQEYADLGFGEFVLSGWPHLEEAYRVGEQVVPFLR